VHFVLALVVDSATPAVTAAVADVGDDGDEIRAVHRDVDPRAHGELLAPAVETVLALAGARPRDLAAIVAGLGPGPFTGLRVGLVTAASMGQVLGIPTYGVCSLDAIGVVAPGEAAAPVLVATDARRREVYWGLYAEGGRVSGPDVDLPSIVAARARTAGARLATGDGATRYADELGRLGFEVLDEPRYPAPEGFVALSRDRILAKAPGDRLTPLYLRRPDAVASASRKSVLP
jgi:tRNA threonylcarbamoyl adenosine modification protein YeaZ